MERVRYLLFSVFFLLAYFTVLYPQGIMYINDDVMPENIYFAPITLFLILSFLMLSPYVITRITPILIAYLIFLLFIALSAMSCVSRGDGNVINVLRNLWAYWGYIIIAGLSYIFRLNQKDRKYYKLFIAAFLACALIGVAQFLLQSPIYTEKSLNGVYDDYATNFFGFVRSTGLFIWPITFGYFLSLCTAWFTYEIVLGKGTFIYSCLLVSALVLTGMTITRSSYLMSALGVLFGYFAAKNKYHLLLFFPIISIALFLFFMLDSTFIHSILGGSITSDQSLMIRFTEWKNAFSLVSNSFEKQAFGTGITQSGAGIVSHPVIIDNAYLASFVQVGLFGTISYLIFVTLMYLFMVRIISTKHYKRLTNSGLMVGAAGFVGLSFGVSIVNLTFQTVGLTFLLFLFLLASEGSSTY